ncbi:MAG TPA: helix-turn-helix transcriptional regulator [Gemmatimonadaceae bacterium]
MIDIMYDISVAPIVRAVREGAGLSQRALAERAHTTQAVIARIESGASAPSLDTLRRLVTAAGYEVQLSVVRAPAPDPVIEAYKRDVDRTLLLENLRKTPEQRAQTLVAMARLASEMRRARTVAERTR